MPSGPAVVILILNSIGGRQTWRGDENIEQIYDVGLINVGGTWYYSTVQVGSTSPYTSIYITPNFLVKRNHCLTTQATVLW